MFKGFYNLTSGMLTQGRRLDVISNNMTNVSTAGFKSDRFTSSTFEEVMWLRAGNKTKNYEELGMQSFITAPSELYTNYAQSSFDETNLPLDFAIEGDGFFALETEDGNRTYTRNGHFSLDDDGYLWSPGQGHVLDWEGQPIRLGTDKLNTDDYGGVFIEGGGAFLGRIGVFTFPDNHALRKNAQGLFDSDQPGEAALVRVRSGMLERANVDWIQEMVDMISSERAYQSMAQVSKMYDEVMTKATNDIGRLA